MRNKEKARMTKGDKLGIMITLLLFGFAFYLIVTQPITPDVIQVQPTNTSVPHITVPSSFTSTPEPTNTPTPQIIVDTTTGEVSEESLPLAEVLLTPRLINISSTCYPIYNQLSEPRHIVGELNRGQVVEVVDVVYCQEGLPLICYEIRAVKGHPITKGYTPSHGRTMYLENNPNIRHLVNRDVHDE